MLTIENLYKIFPARRANGEDVHAVSNVNLSIKEGELFTLLGPSGCGKTTTLRSIAGFERPTSGFIAVGGRVLFDSEKRINVPVNSRGLGMVFQSYAIWPHMNVFDNVAFPLTVKRPGQKRFSKKQIIERVERVLSTVHLDHLMERPATDLSGGQQQRLALARALVMEPPLLLLDEPLSNLDAKLREQMRFELKRLQRDLNITSIYVTHDQVEALSMSSRIAVMNGGGVEQLGTPFDIYGRPTSRFVADFIGTSNLIDGVIGGTRSNNSYQVRTKLGDILAISEDEIAAGSKVIINIRPENLVLIDEKQADEAPGNFAAEVVTGGFLGDAIEYEIRVGEMILRMRSAPENSLQPGQQIRVNFPARWCTIIPQ